LSTKAQFQNTLSFKISLSIKILYCAYKQAMFDIMLNVIIILIIEMWLYIINSSAVAIVIILFILCIVFLVIFLIVTGSYGYMCNPIHCIKKLFIFFCNQTHSHHSQIYISILSYIYVSKDIILNQLISFLAILKYPFDSSLLMIIILSGLSMFKPPFIGAFRTLFIISICTFDIIW
jgi:hypothetical protein